jgi:hypothetical protein
MKSTKSPPIVDAKRANQACLHQYSPKNTAYRKFDRSLLPTPASYYSKQFQKLKIKSEWITTHCCFHDDKTPSLSINLVAGHFRCFGCGAKGGDIVAFHQLKYGMSFIEAVNCFGAWSYE